MTTNNELLPCPFCGGQASFERRGTPRQSCIVVCGWCGCRHESGDEGAKCGESWNTRQPAMPADAEFQITQDGFIVAGAEGPRDQAWAEIQRYAAQYAEDGPVEIWEVTRRRIEGEP